MVYLTVKAAHKFLTIRQEKLRKNAAMRVAVIGGGCAGLKYFIGLDDMSEQDDFAMESQGIPILIDRISLPYVQGSEIDWIEIGKREGFAILNNPNQAERKSGCGSGEGGCKSGNCGCKSGRCGSPSSETPE
ncbi:MAG: iron-sulfur cluster assembly accessory protein [Candidatus Omnitrophota bacterium]